MDDKAKEICVLDQKVRLHQPEGGFRTALDSVMLAAACPAQAGQRVLDMGCGVGGATFCLAWRVPDLLIEGIDIQAQYIDLAEKNKDINKNTQRIEFSFSDIRTARPESPAARFDHIICNPPFLEAGTYIPSPDASRATALGHEGQDCTLEDWIDCALHNLFNGGCLTMIHRADHVDRIIMALGKRFGQTEIIPLYPRVGVAAKRVIIRTRKDRHSPASLHPGLILHSEDGTYSAAAEAILRQGAALV